MENNESNINRLQRKVNDGIQDIANKSIDSYKSLMTDFLDKAPSIGNVLSTVNNNIKGFTLKQGNCCPDEYSCPPQCIATINRQAMEGETIIVPFIVKNDCSVQRTYRVGVRELVDLDNNPAPSQPYLNKQSITLAPNAQERVLMTVNLHHFNKEKYFTEIVLLEKEINQNICFNLSVKDHSMVAAIPNDEKSYQLQWQSWKSHFYCEPKKRIKGEPPS